MAAVSIGSDSGVAAYLYPRVCPILTLSREDLERGFKLYGREATVNSLASLIVDQYDFPYLRHSKRPRDVEEARLEGRTTSAPPTMLLGGYRCSRLPSDVKIPGITLVMHDAVSLPDWDLDSHMEPHRMKCWVAVQGRIRRWTDEKHLRSPEARITHPETLAKLIETEIVADKHQRPVTHGILRDVVIGNSEAVPPTVELYLHTITKLKPASIFMAQVTYGAGLAALDLIANNDTPCHYQLTSLTPEAAASMKKYLGNGGGSRYFSEGRPSYSDLTFIDAIPYGSHDMRAYLGEESTPKHVTYAEHLRRTIIDPLIQLVDQAMAQPESSSSAPARIALVISLRELATLPSVEPILLTILSHPKLASQLQVVGALVSQKRDYAVYLMILRPGGVAPSGTRWGEYLKTLYPELLLSTTVTSTAAPVKASALPPPPEAPSWVTACLREARLALRPPSVEITVQGPRPSGGRAAFPTRTRRRTIISETATPEGGMHFVFGAVVEPPPPPLSVAPPALMIIPSDPHLSRMVSDIQESIKLESGVSVRG